MGIKEQVLLLLENQKGNLFSGQEIADRLLVTRASIWKAVMPLKADQATFSTHSLYLSQPQWHSLPSAAT